MSSSFTRCKVQKIYSFMELTTKQMNKDEYKVSMKERLHPSIDLESLMLILQFPTWSSPLGCPRVLRVFKSDMK